ncbi:MAG TPA: hypothetical protein VLE51_02950 [Candidatus Saccharimonadales bacterium]|nr:hypothetical protein [Candidatus Saccharimonadales bacterium]
MRRRVVGTDVDKLNPMKALLAALSDDLALPFLQIKSSLEVLDEDNFSKKSTLSSKEQIILSIENGLHLIEAYKLTLRINSDVDSMTFEPVAIGAVLQDVAHELTPYAKKYATDLQVDVSGRLTPVLTHQASLQTAIQILSASLIRAQAAQVQQKRYKLLLGAHRSSESVISTGVFSSIEGLSDKTLRNARLLVGRARQPLPSMPAGAASGVLIADMLCSSMWQPLRAAAHGGLHGIATAIPVSKQLQFV